jgi:hypothetical protein
MDTNTRKQMKNSTTKEVKGGGGGWWGEGSGIFIPSHLEEFKNT